MEHVCQRLAIVGQIGIVMLCWYVCIDTRDIVLDRVVKQPCLESAGSLTAHSHIACRAHAVPLPCRAANGLECVFPI